MASGAKQLLGGLVAAVALALFVAPSAAAFTVHGSVRQVYVLGARPGERLTLLGRRGRSVSALQGGTARWRGVPRVAPGSGYRVGDARRRSR